MPLPIHSFNICIFMIRVISNICNGVYKVNDKCVCNVKSIVSHCI